MMAFFRAPAAHRPTKPPAPWPLCWLAIFALTFASSALSRGDESSPKTRSKSAAKAKADQKEKPPVEKSDDDDAAPATTDDTALETDEDLTALVVPDGPLTKLKASERMKFSQELRGLLLEGMGNPLDGLATAKRHFDGARQAAPDEPRGAYAYGVALLSHNQPKEAIEQFRAAARQSPAPYLPALHAIVWAHVLKNDYARALPAVHDLARHIEESKGGWPTDHDRLHSAEWLGRMMGFLTGPGKPTSDGEAIDRLAADLQRVFTDERKNAYERGMKNAAARHSELKTLAARPVNEVLAEMKQKRQEIIDASKAADAEVKRLEEAQRDIKKPHDKRVAELNHDLREAATNSKKAHREIADAEELVDELSVPRQYPSTSTMSRYRVRVPTMRNENAAEKKARETQLTSAQQKLTQGQSALDRAKQQMTDAKSQREQAEAEYRRAVADRRPALTAARQKAQELAARAKDVEQPLTAEKLKSRVTALESYVPFDPVSEKNRLLATLKPAG
jgi:hypothetical protein